MTGPPMILQGAARYPVREIILNCSATRPDWLGASSLAAKRAEIRRWHMQDRGWRNIGYHWLIDFDGQEANGHQKSPFSPTLSRGSKGQQERKYLI